MKKAITIVVLLLFRNVLMSETVKWIVRPQYDFITYYSSDIFKCINNNRIVLLDWSGEPLINQDLMIDSVTNFVGGYALVLKSESGGNKIIGFISEQRDHAFQRLDGDFYATEYPFFSEGYLVVSNPSGKKGYINETGQCVIDCKYDKARPFRKGMASVQINVSKTETRGYYINPLGQTKNPLEFYDGKIDKGSSFNDNGEAVVKHDRECAIIDRNMKVVRNRPYDRVFPIRTYDYAYSEDYSNPKPIVNQKPVIDDRFVIFESESKYGYRGAGGEVIVPVQFDEVQPVCDNRAIVSIGGKFGILEFVEGQFICSSFEGKLVVYPEMNYNNTRFEVQVPGSLDHEKLHLMFDKGDGKLEEANLKMDFKPLFENGAMTCTMRAQLHSDDGLLLWKEEKSIDIAYVRISISSPETVSVYAKENGVQQIKVCITNDSDIEVEVLPSFELFFGRKTKNKPYANTTDEPIRLLPGEKRELFVDVKVAENEDVNAKVSVTVDGFDCGVVFSQVSLRKI